MSPDKIRIEIEISFAPVGQKDPPEALKEVEVAVNEICASAQNESPTIEQPLSVEPLENELLEVAKEVLDHNQEEADRAATQPEAPTSSVSALATFKQRQEKKAERRKKMARWFNESFLGPGFWGKAIIEVGKKVLGGD